MLCHVHQTREGRGGQRAEGQRATGNDVSRRASPWSGGSCDPLFSSHYWCGGSFLWTATIPRRHLHPRVLASSRPCRSTTSGAPPLTQRRRIQNTRRPQQPSVVVATGDCQRVTGTGGLGARHQTTRHRTRAHAPPFDGSTACCTLCVRCSLLSPDQHCPKLSVRGAGSNRQETDQSCMPLPATACQSSW